MNIMTLLYCDENVIRYLYRPESEGKSGIIAYDRKSKTASVELMAEDDGSGYYADKAKWKVSAIAEWSCLPVKYIQAWR